eukprot:7561586-Pyramimonas_sp.AAC.1
MKLGSNGFRGILFLIDGEVVQDLYVVSENASDNRVIVPGMAALKNARFAEADVTTAADIAKSIKRQETDALHVLNVSEASALFCTCTAAAASPPVRLSSPRPSSCSACSSSSSSCSSSSSSSSRS